MYSEDNDQCGKHAVHLRTACKTAFHCKCCHGRQESISCRAGLQTNYVWQTCNTILHSSTISLVCAFGHLNQFSFLQLNVGIFIGCSLITLTLTGQPSMLLLLTVNTEFACPNTKPKMSLPFSDKAAHSVLNREELSQVKGTINTNGAMGSLLKAISEPSQGATLEIPKNKKPEEKFQPCLQIMKMP